MSAMGTVAGLPAAPVATRAATPDEVRTARALAATGLAIELVGCVFASVAAKDVPTPVVGAFTGISANEFRSCAERKMGAAVIGSPGSARAPAQRSHPPIGSRHDALFRLAGRRALRAPTPALAPAGAPALRRHAQSLLRHGRCPAVRAARKPAIRTRRASAPGRQGRLPRASGREMAAARCRAGGEPYARAPRRRRADLPR